VFVVATVDQTRGTRARCNNGNAVAASSMIYEWGKADLEIAGARGEPSSRSVGRYVTVWKRDASGWRIIRNLSLAN